MAFDAQLTIKERPGDASLTTSALTSTRVFRFHYNPNGPLFNSYVPPNETAVLMEFFQHTEYILHPTSLAPVSGIQSIQRLKHDGTLWEVVVDYSLKTRNVNPPAELLELAPWFEPPVYSWEMRPVEEVVRGAFRVEVVGGPAHGTNVSDPDGHIPIVNSAHDPFEEPMVRNTYQPTLRIDRATLNYSPDSAKDLMDKVNADVYRGAEPGQALIQDVRATNAWFHGYEYWNESWEILFNFKACGWNSDVLDAGYYAYTNAGSAGFKKSPIVDDEGNPCTTPQLLDGQGRVMGFGDPGITTDGVFLRFTHRESITFADVVP